MGISLPGNLGPAWVTIFWVPIFIMNLGPFVKRGTPSVTVLAISVVELASYTVQAGYKTHSIAIIEAMH